ncbi:uncharacterized protein K02A2.6-like [Notechis scutatus]|uniref:Uncharacterized protein K02A2.6-like n=1 Tax=Notechis scutatus TaxID=8663 RepID=A0A6J1V0D3_9SAUR|nr:uncharacterized protein K02A2.6-like [Notechis scutatus]
MDKEIETWVTTCTPCQESRPSPPAAKPRKWETPTTPWGQIHVDFAGPCQGQTFLIVVDMYSKWLEVILMQSTTSEVTIKALRHLFTTHGLPDVLVSDNGLQFNSKPFEAFLAELGIRHALSAPAHLATNGQVEIMVRSTKETLQRMDQENWQERIDRMLLAQHITPHTTTQRSPAELLMGRWLHTVLDRVHPNYSTETPPDSPGKCRQFTIGDPVYAHSYTGGPTWVPARVVENTGPWSYREETEEGKLWERHINQL